MGPVNAELAIDLEREGIFDFVADLANRPAFTSHFISEFRLSRIGSRGVGAGARFRVRLPANSVWMDTVIEELTEPQRISERGRGGRSNRIGSATVWEFLEGPGSLTTVKVTFWTQPSTAGHRAKELMTATSLWYSRAWAEALRKLRGVLESDQGRPEPVRVAGGTRFPTDVP
jgi:hypothetical protein